MTWQDYGDTKGFHVFDTDTRLLKFIPNPYQMFYRIVYNDELNDYGSEDMSKYHNVYVKVVVEKKQNTLMYDRFLEKLYQANPFNVSIVQNYADIIEISDNFVADQSQTTVSMLHSFLDSVSLPDDVESQQMKNLFTDIYQEAVNLE